MPTLRVIFENGVTVDVDGDASAIDATILYWTTNHANPASVENEIAPPLFANTVVYRCVDVVGLVVLP